MIKNVLIPQTGNVTSTKDALNTNSLNGGLKNDFKEALKKATKVENLSQASESLNSQLKFSSHAMSRMRDRAIYMDKNQLNVLEKAVDTAASKGSKESLILTPDAAFIVSVKNKTVITVVDRASANGNVFTNIDSTIVV